MAVFLEGNSLHVENNLVWIITVLIPASVHRDFQPMICGSLCFFLQLTITSHKSASVSTVSGLHLTIYSPLHFLFFFWRFQYKISVYHFKLYFQTKFNFKIDWKQKGVFYSGQCRFVGSLFQQKKWSQDYSHLSYLSLYLPNQKNITSRTADLSWMSG